MTARVAGYVTRDTGRDISALLNATAAKHDLDPVELLGGAVISEAGGNEHAIRERAWPDCSYGIGQPAVKWFDRSALSASVRPHIALEADGTLADTDLNRSAVRGWMWDAERALAYVAPRYARLRAIYGDPVEAWARWNKPNVPGRDNPNRPHILRSLAEAEQYRMEERMPFAIPIPKRVDFAATPEGTAEYQKSLLEYAVAALAVDENGAAIGALRTLNPVRYADLGKA